MSALSSPFANQGLPIALVGMPGSGKTTLGKHLARRFSIEFFDVDAEIEKHIGCSIRDFFDHEGESEFRKVESLAIQTLTRHKGSVISTGGGAVLCSDNREVLRKNCYCIYLRTTPEEIFRRLRHDRKRPLLQVQEPLKVLYDLFNERDSLYLEVANLVVDTRNYTFPNLLNFLSTKLRDQNT